MGGANEGGGGVFLVDVTEDGGGGSGGRNPPFELPADLLKVGRCNFIKKDDNFGKRADHNIPTRQLPSTIIIITTEK